MDEEIKKLLEQNLKLTQEIYGMTRKIKSYLAFQRLVSVFYIIIIVAPIVFGIIFLPPLLKPMIDQYKDLLSLPTGATDSVQNLLRGSAGGLNLNNLNVDQIKSLLNK